MSDGRKPTTVCDGCGKESEETCWWRHVTEQTHTNTGLSYDVAVQPEDYCPDCWKLMISEFRKKQAHPKSA